MTNVHDTVDEFVRVVRLAGVPVSPLDDTLRVEQFENKLPARLPVSFRSLIARYAFPAFTVGALDLFANNVEDEQELTRAVFADQIMAGATHRAGYIQFARPADGSYDPVCFDTRVRAGNREYTVVRLEHEAILIKSRIVVREAVAKSFFEFLKSVVAMNVEQSGKIIALRESAGF